MIPVTEALRRTGLGYRYDRRSQINHLFYMDDLMLYARSTAEVERLVKLVYEISTDIKMEFGISKCGVLNIE